MLQNSKIDLLSCSLKILLYDAGFLHTKHYTMHIGQKLTWSINLFINKRGIFTYFNPQKLGEWRWFPLQKQYFLLSLSRVPTWRTNCDQRLLSESFFRFSIEKAQVTVCWQQCLKAETAFQIETIVWSTFGDFKIKWFARAEVLISAFVEYFLFRDNEKATDGDGDSAAVWPDWAIFKVLGDNFSYKSSANIRLLFGLLWKIPF